MTDSPRTPIDRDVRRLDDALPWYLNGTLERTDHEWVESQLGDDDTRLQFDRKIIDLLDEQAQAVPADLGWEALLRRVRTDAGPAVAPLAGRVADQGPLARLGDFFASLLTPRLGLAMAALLAVQTVTIGWLLTEGQNESQLYRSGGALQPVPVIRALLPETLPEKSLRTALTANGLTIVGGPTALGEYFLQGEAGSLAAVAEQLKQQGTLISWSIEHRALGR
ncbi:MAG: hypothetical protein R3E68_09460 [Burkholderiaceae bacterium]